MLLARARRADEAASVLDEAAELEPKDPIPRELAGTLSAWAEDIVPREHGALAYVDAARRRSAAGDDEAALEDLLRGFELCPASARAARGVAAALSEQSRPLAADETLRDHARALELDGRVEAAREVHAGRLAAALKQREVGIALSAALDLDLAGTKNRADVDAHIDEALSLAGLPDLVTARLERRAHARVGAARASAFEALGRHLSAASATDDRLVTAWIEAAVADPTQATALDALRQLAEHDEDREPLAEALVRILSGERGEQHASQLALARLAVELVALAQTLDDPRLADWALSRARALEPAHADSAAHDWARIEAALGVREDEIARAERAVGATGEGSTREGRVDALRELARLLGKSPASEQRVFEALAGLCRAEPKDARAARSLALSFERDPSPGPRADLYESVVRARLEAPLGRRDHVRVRLQLAALGSGRAAHDELVALLDLPDAGPLGASHVLLSCIGAGDPKGEARALVALASGAERHTAALLHSAAADAFRRGGGVVEARREAEVALDLDAACSRAASVLAAVASTAGGREAAAAIERALGLVVPRAWLCDALARSLEAIGENELAFAWTHRWLALAPSDRRAMSELLRRCQLGPDASRIAEALTWVLAQPDPADERAPLVLDALTMLFGLDPAKGGQVARRVLDVLGPSPRLREALRSLADEHNDAALAIAVLERAIAADPDAPRDLLLELAHRRAGASDVDGAALELLRAAAAGLDPAELLTVADEIELTAREHPSGGQGGLGSDGVVALAEVRSRTLAAMLAAEVGSPQEAAQGRAITRSAVAQAWRSAGAARWDLAQDPRGAEVALFFAAEVGAERAAYDLYARDLASLAGPERAIDAIFERLTSRREAPPEERLALALSLANLAAEHGHPRAALDAALAALAVERSNAEAIALAEWQAAQVEDGHEAIDGIYTALAESALGMYGRRAAHYRAARQLERLGARDHALSHALKAFEAVPTEGTSWAMLTRLTDPVAGSLEAVALFTKIAREAKGGDKSGWFKRALELSGSDREGLARRLEILELALDSVPDASFAEALREVVSGLQVAGGLPEGACSKIASTIKRAIRDLEGPDGARAAARLGRVVAEAGVDLDLGPERDLVEDAAFSALEKAVEIDGEVEVFGVIAPGAYAFSLYPERAARFVALVLARIEERHALVGPPLLRFASAIADGLTDAESSANLLAEAERREAAEAVDGAASGTSEHEDPFADPSMLDSSPPPALVPEPAPAPSPAPPDAAPAAPAARPSLRLDSEPPPSGEASGPESLADLVDLASEPPALVPAPTASRRGSGAHPRVVAELTSIKDGFAALFDSTAPPPPTLELEREEEDARGRGDHEAVAELLLRRIRASSRQDEIRVLKLRRAALLEQRLSRPDQARAELDELLAKDPNDKSALSFLADMHERRGEIAQAAALFGRLSSLSVSEPEERRRYALASARAHQRAGDLAAALRALDAVTGELADAEVVRLRVDLLRASEDRFSLLHALDQLAALPGQSDEEQAITLVEAARTAVAVGDVQAGSMRARRAARLAPELPDAVLVAVELEYRTQGTGTPREAQQLVESLRSLPAELTPAQVELQSFLLAEGLDVKQGGGAGLRELSHRHAEVGPLPLIALGMAERLLRTRSFEAAVPLFAAALAGDLRGMRSQARVALAATDAAIQAGDLEAARSFLAEAEKGSELRALVERRRKEILAFDEQPSVARPVIEELLKDSTGGARARLLQRLAQMELDANFDLAIQLYEDALMAARRDRPMVERIRREVLQVLEARGVEANVEPPPPSSEPPSSPSVASIDPDSAPRPALVPSSEGPASGADQSSPEEAGAPPDSGDVVDADPAWLEEGRASEPNAARSPEPPPETARSLREPEPSPVAASPVPEPERASTRAAPLGPLAPAARPLFLNAREDELFQSLLDGDLDAADALVSIYEGSGGARARDALVVRRHQVALMPGATAGLTALRDAALADRDEVYARAVDHVLSVALGRPTAPPPLFAQPREAELVTALLFRDVASRESEALAIAWEAGLHRRELASYGVTGSDRVALTANTVLGELYSEIAAVLGASRPLFHKRTEPSSRLGVALLSQPAIVALGEHRSRSPELAYELAAAHASASGDLVLAAHLDDETIERLLTAMVVAFGPVAPRDDDAPVSSASAAATRQEVARLASELWQRINPRAERRLRALCELGPLEPAVGRASARRAMRRAGLFASGDLGVALRALAVEERYEVPPAGEPLDLDALCRESAEAEDLVRLATRMEYAEARWQLPSPSSVRR
ncbi:MAG: hypothetical protein IPG04_02065 [Polyangiaceae bacterium]|nr:hypothetical protein [Polyangiaceae bacterium]